LLQRGEIRLGSEVLFQDLEQKKKEQRNRHRPVEKKIKKKEKQRKKTRGDYHTMGDLWGGQKNGVRSRGIHKGELGEMWENKEGGKKF